MGMANIHSIRKSFQSLRFLCTQMPDPAKYVFCFKASNSESDFLVVTLKLRYWNCC